MNYLTKILDWKNENVASHCDELSIWSAPFGLMMMDNFPIGDYKNYLDIGFGTGFPLIEISQRLGNRCKVYGVDPWESAFKRAKSKIDTLGLNNITLISQDASNMDFTNDYFDLITSNLGINNFEDPAAILSECFRVLKKGASFCITTNLTGTFNEFYEIYHKTLHELKMEQYISKLEEHVKHRGTIESTINLVENAGFKISKQIEDSFKMRYLNGSAFLNHSFTLISFMDIWRNMFTEDDKHVFFKQFEINLNEYATKRDGLELSVPMFYLECRK